MSQVNENEAKVIVKTSTGGSLYKNSTTAADIEEAKELYSRLRKQIQSYAKKYSDDNPNSIQFRYQIGNLLYDISHAEGVTNSVRTEFMQELEDITDLETLIGRPLGGAGSDKRHPYLLTCLWLYTYFAKDIALSLVWSDWSELYSRPKIRNDSRIPKWIAKNKQSITREEIREVFKEMTYLAEDYDLSFMDDEDVYSELNKALSFERNWQKCFEKFFESKTENLSEARRTRAAKYKEMYIRACMDQASFVPDDEIANVCENAFVEIYVNV